MQPLRVMEIRTVVGLSEGAMLMRELEEKSRRLKVDAICRAHSTDYQTEEVHSTSTEKNGFARSMGQIDLRVWTVSSSG